MKTTGQRVLLMRAHGFDCEDVAKEFDCSSRAVRDYVRDGVRERGARGPKNISKDVLEYIVKRIRDNSVSPLYRSLTVEQFTGVVDIPDTQSTDIAAVG